MTKPADFSAWLIEDIESVTAELNTPRDLQLKAFETEGFLRTKWTYGNTSDYEITAKGALALGLAPSVDAKQLLDYAHALWMIREGTGNPVKMARDILERWPLVSTPKDRTSEGRP